MILNLHQYENDEVIVKLEFENETEKNVIEFFFGKGTQNKFQGTADSCNGIFLETKKKLKQ